MAEAKIMKKTPVMTNDNILINWPSSLMKINAPKNKTKSPIASKDVI